MTVDEDRPALPSDVEPPGTAAARLLGGLLCGLLLILPLYGALGSDSIGGLMLWMLAGAAAGVGCGLLVGRVVDHGLGVCVATLGMFLAAALAGAWLVAWIGDPPANGVIALVVAVPSAALAALGATALTGSAREATAPLAAVLTFVILGISLGMAPAIGTAIDEARHDADLARELEASTLSPYVPEISDLEVTYIGATRLGGQPTRYTLRYEPESDGGPARVPYLSVEVGELHNFQDCDTDPSSSFECRQGDGYYVLTKQPRGVVEYVVSNIHGSAIVAHYAAGSDDLPSPDEVGRALAAAEETTWEEVVSRG